MHAIVVRAGATSRTLVLRRMFPGARTRRIHAVARGRPDLTATLARRRLEEHVERLLE